MPDLKMTLACWNYDRTRALMDGSVKPEGIDLTYHNSFPAATFHRMMGKREFEASELGLTFYLDSLHEDDPPFVAIPVYPIRLFSHSAIYINTRKGIEQSFARITEEVANFLDHPVGWTRPPVDDDEAQQAIAPIRQVVFSGLHTLALHRLIDEHLADWRRGMDHKGKGSAARRAVDIRGIYELAAPIPGTVNSAPALEFMRGVRDLVRAAVEENGGTMLP